MIHQRMRSCLPYLCPWPGQNGLPADDITEFSQAENNLAIVSFVLDWSVDRACSCIHFLWLLHVCVVT